MNKNEHLGKEKKTSGHMYCEQYIFSQR